MSFMRPLFYKIVMITKLILLKSVMNIENTLFFPLAHFGTHTFEEEIGSPAKSSCSRYLYRDI